MSLFSWHFFSIGYGVMALLWLLAGIMTIFTLERWLFFRRYNIDAVVFLDGIRNLVQQEKIIEAIDLCDHEGSPISHVIRTSLLNKNLPLQELKANIRSTAILEISRCERHIMTILTIAKLAPNIAMIGIVIAFYSAFNALQSSGLTYVNCNLFDDAVTGGMLMLIVSLAVNIFSNLAYNFLYSRVQSIVYQLEWTCNECLQIVLAKKL